MAKKPRNWKQYLHLLEFVYKSSTHTSIGYSPSTSMYDFQLRPLPMLTLIEMYIKFCQGYARNVKTYPKCTNFIQFISWGF